MFEKKTNKRRKTRNTYIFFIMLFGHSCPLPPFQQGGRNQSRREEAVIFLHYLSCLFQNLSFFSITSIVGPKHQAAINFFNDLSAFAQYMNLTDFNKTSLRYRGLHQPLLLKLLLFYWYRPQHRFSVMTKATKTEENKNTSFAYQSI
jgi:hypothetical protein